MFVISPSEHWTTVDPRVPATPKGQTPSDLSASWNLTGSFDSLTVSSRELDSAADSDKEEETFEEAQPMVEDNGALVGPLSALTPSGPLEDFSALKQIIAELSSTDLGDRERKLVESLTTAIGKMARAKNKNGLSMPMLLTRNAQISNLLTRLSALSMKPRAITRHLDDPALASIYGPPLVGEAMIRVRRW